MQGDLGYSFIAQQPVAPLIVDRVGATLTLTVTALAFASVGGVVLGVMAARLRGGPVDTGIQTAGVRRLFDSRFLARPVADPHLRDRPGLVAVAGQPADPRPARRTSPACVEQLRYLLLPAFALSLRYLTLITRITRAAMLEVMNADFILAARARGASEWTVMTVHALRNAAAPVITVIGYNVGFILAGSALIEAVFAWPGIGRLLFESISKRDYPVMLAILLMVSATVVVANLVTDIVHRLIDPRIERQ